MAEDAIVLIGGEGSTVYSDVIYQLQEWFPQHRIERSLPVVESSSGGHLAFWLGIPALSIHRRKKGSAMAAGMGTC